MVQLGLGVTFLVLSLTGLVSCWAVCIAFARATGSRWAVYTYLFGSTVLQLAFSLGAVWKMDTYRMPKGFCTTQTLLISISTYIVTGVCAAFTLATNNTIKRPKYWSNPNLSGSTLQWKNYYIFPTVVFPAGATIVYTTVVLKLGASGPSRDMHCDAVNPLWVRLLGYAGLPLLLAIPSLLLSVYSLIKTIRITKHIKRSRSDEMECMPRRSRMPPEPTSAISRIWNSGCRWGPHASNDEMRMPPRHKFVSTRDSASSDLPDFAQARPPSVPQLQPDFSAVVCRDSDSTHNTVDCTDSDRDDVSSLVWAAPDVMIQSTPEADPDDNTLPEKDAESSFTNIDDSDDEDMFGTKRMRSVSSAMPVTRKRRHPPEFLPPAVWRILIFQITFSLVAILAAVSPVIELCLGWDQPSALGTQSFALVLVAWGPAIVFLPLPAVRQNLMFWRR
ncbi:hypothetical protein CYLTODRAFT_451356 [Cylindrobasidium torrendii FP15055 ss-10]|uniref:G-protein coupled receptors family 2 profile 2 domain-containing protein n=1 Tax=Cylindrobasidium torrendii FP15055 ss-10 TaxID=1314674 RepID=A0A0D7BK66_9AGAR|nr:hypothetical protein CYLTODRAFT_451356 [Cylindrobasidium torrendii FP15055 ss-10]